MTIKKIIDNIVLHNDTSSIDITNIIDLKYLKYEYIYQKLYIIRCYIFIIYKSNYNLIYNYKYVKKYIRLIFRNSRI